jgi:preprotein translocase subunit SecA
MRIFAGDRVRAIMDRLKMPEGEPIEAGIVTRSIESAQRKVEGRNFDIRKQLLKYDDVANDQRKVIYQQRNDVLEAQDVGDMVATCARRAHRPVPRVRAGREHGRAVGHRRPGAAPARRLELELPLAKTIEGAQSIDDEDCWT